MGLWVQTCNQDIYAYGHMAPEETLATTCQNNLVVYGLYTTRSSVAKYVVSTLQVSQDLLPLPPGGAGHLGQFKAPLHTASQPFYGAGPKRILTD